MKTSSLCLFGGALLGAGLSSNANADLTFSDTLEFSSAPYTGTYAGYHYSIGDGEIHTFDFTVLSDGNVQFDMLSVDIFDAFFNSQIVLFNNDGNALSYANRVAYNYGNYGSDPDFNGSTSNEDAFMDIFLAAGDYTVAIGTLGFDPSQADAGMGRLSVVSYIDQATSATGGQYQFDIIGDVSNVPAPGAFALLGLGGIAATRRRR
jgi:MYXO-CTERM domain-containing protein